MKKLLILMTTLLLFSCGESPSSTSNLEIKETDFFSIEVPSAWEVIPNDDKSLPKPKDGDVELAVTSNEVKGGFANTLLILSQDLKKTTTSKEYSRLNNIGSTKEYLNYTSLDNKDFILNDEDETKLYIFEAKYNATTPVYKFIQVGKVCDKKGYLITVGLSLDIKDTSKYEDFLKTFKCKVGQK